MKVLFFITRGDEIGGAQTHVRDVILGLKSHHGIECILATGSLGNFTNSMESQGVKVFHIKSLKRDICIHDIKAFFELRTLLRKIKPDIISCHSSKAGVLGRLAAVDMRVKRVFTAHGWAFTEGVSKSKAKFYKKIEFLLSFITDAIINVSEYDRGLAKRNNIRSEHYVIHNCISDNKLSNEEEPIPKQYDMPLKFVMVARFCDQKDHETLLNAFAKVDKKQWRLTLLGGGNSNAIKQLSNKLGVSDRIDFVGEVSDVSKFLENSDVFILISNWEGFPISIIEAMRIGLPIIASDVGGVSEAVEEHRNGYLIPRKDTGTLEHILLGIVNSPSSLKKLGRASRLIYEKKFTLSNMVDSYYKVFSEVMK